MHEALRRHRLIARGDRPLLLIPVFGVLLVAGLWLAIVSRLDSERETTLASEMRETEGFAGAFAEYSIRELRDIDRTTRFVKAQFERDGVVDLHFLRRSKLLPDEGLIRVTVTDRAGRIIDASGDFSEALNVANRDYFRMHAARDAGQLDISQGRATGGSESPPIVISRRLNLQDGSFGGIVIVTVDPAYFADFYRESTLGKQGMLAVLSMDGVYRVRRMGDHVDAALDGSTTPLFAAAMVNDAGSYIRDSVIDHTRRLVAYRKLAGYPLIVAVARAEDEVLADFTQRRIVYLATGAVATAIMIIFFAANTLLAFRAHRSAREARRQKSFLQALVDNLPMSVMVRSMKTSELGRVVLWNPAAEFIFGVRANEALGKTIHDVFPPDRAAAVEERDRALLESPMVQEVPRLVIDIPQRERRLCHVVRVPVFDADDQVEYIVSITHDITDEQARADELRLISTVFETTADAIVLSDADDRVIAVNAAFTKVTGFEPGEMLDKLVTESPFAPSDLVQYAARQEQLGQNGYVSAEVTRYRKDGSELPCWLTKNCVRDDGGNIVNYVRVFTDISQLKKAQQRLEQFASFDTLTGLPNRRLFDLRLEQVLKRSERLGGHVGLLFIDLDGLKSVNDIHGHDAGDALLREVANRLRQSVRAGDSLCRLGGDEFTVIVEDATLPQDAIAVAERIVATLAVPFDIAGRAIRSGASVGIALYPAHGRDAATLVKSADVAMYRAKQSGGRRYKMAASSFQPIPAEVEHPAA